MASSPFPQDHHDIYYHEAFSSLAKRISTSTDRTPSDSDNQEINIRCERVWHHQYQDASGPVRWRLRNVQTQDCVVWEQPTRRIPCAHEEFQVRDWQDREYVSGRKDKLYTYSIMWGITLIFWQKKARTLEQTMHTWSSPRRVYSGVLRLTPFSNRSAQCAVQCVNLVK